MNDHLLYATRGAKKIHYIYDSYGNVLAAIYKRSAGYDEQTYYYAHNWRGDVVALYDSTGALFATYEYDAWGKLISINITTVLIAAFVTAVFIMRKRRIK